MSSHNNCQFIGRIASDPNITQGKDAQGQAYTKISFSFAVQKVLSKQHKQQNDAAKAAGQPQPYPDASFILVTASGGKADTLAKYGVKGKPLALSCEMYQFPKANTQNETVTAFSIQDIGFLPVDNTAKNAPAAAPQQGYQQQAPQGYQQPAGQYQQPAGQYQQPAPQYQQPAPQYQQPAQQGYVQPGQQPIPQAPGVFVPNDDDIPF